MVKESFHNHLGQQLRIARRKRGMTQAAVIAAAGLSRPTMTLLERGRGTLASFFTVLDCLDLKLTGRNLPAAKTLGVSLARLRRRREIKQRELAALVPCSRPTVTALEQGRGGRLIIFDRCLYILGAGAYLAHRDAPKRFYTHAGTSSAGTAWKTPQWLLERLYSIFDTFDLDPCSPCHDSRCAPVRARIRFTASDDGLSLPWHGTVFMNPPYGRQLPRWLAKARGEVEQGTADTVLALIPARPDTAYWRRDIIGIADVLFLRGRLHFDDCPTPAPFPSALVVWNADRATVEAIAEQFPDAWLHPHDSDVHGRKRSG